MRGRHFWHQLTESALQRSIESFEQAITRDPSYAPAYAGLADAYYFLGLFESLEPSDAYAHGAPAAQRALDLDPNLADAHAAVANFKFSYEWDWAGADREFKRAIDLNPNQSQTHWHYALYLGNLGWLDEALKQLEVARGLDPLWVAPHQSLAYFTLVGGRYEESAAHHRAALELDPHYPLALVTVSWLHLCFGRTEEALAHARQAMSISETPLYIGCFALVCATAGRREEAAAVVRDLQQRSPSRYLSYAALCWVHAALGDLEEAVRCLRIAYEQHDSMFICLLTFFGFDPLRHTDAFRDIVARMKFPHVRPEATSKKTPVTS